MTAALSFKMAYRHVRAGFGRMALSVVAVALGVALVVAFRLMNAAVLESFLDTVDAMAGRAALSVTAGEGLTFSEDTVQAVAAVPGIKLAVPLVRGVAFPDDGSGEMLTVQGVDLTNESAVRVYHEADNTDEVLDDPIAFLNQPDSIVVGREFAERRGLKKETSINLVTPNGVQQFTIKGLLDAQGIARTLRGRLVVMDLYAAERTFTADGQINQIDLLVADGQDVGATKAAVAALLPAGLTVEEPALRRRMVGRTIAGFQAMLTAFSLLAIVAGFVVCYSRLSAIFEARTWEVGLLRAVGMPQASVFAELLKESLLLGGCGIVLGIGFGSLMGYYGLPFLAATTAIALRLPVPSAAAALGTDAFAVGAGVGLVAAIGAALVPALRLSRTQPVAALTMRGRETPRAGLKIRWRVRSVLLAVIGLLLLWERHIHSSAIGHVITGLVVVTTCALASPIVEFGGRLLLMIMPPAFGPTGKTGVAHLVRQPGRTTLTVATLGVGLGTVILFSLLGWSFERTLVSRLAGQLRSDLVITSALLSGGAREAPLSEGVLEQLRAVPGVAAVAAIQQKPIATVYGPVTVSAYDPVSFRDLRLFQWHLDGGALSDALQRVESGSAVMVSTAFAYEHGSRPGDVVELTAPNGTLRLPVAAVALDEPENSIVISRDRYRASWNDALVWQVHVALGAGIARAAAEATIAKELGARFRLRIRSSAELIDYYASLAHQAFSVLYLCETIIFLLVVVAIGDTLASGVVERTHELGMMRAVGLSQVELFAMVVIEGAAIGLLGLVLAAAAGLVLGIFWVEVQFPAILGWKLDLHFPTAFALGAAGLTMLLCLAGSLLPSLRAARLSVPEALRNE